MTRDPWLYFPGFTSLPKEVILGTFYALKNPSTPTGFEPANLGSSGELDNHGTIGVDHHLKGFHHLLLFQLTLNVTKPHPFTHLADNLYD